VRAFHSCFQWIAGLLLLAAIGQPMFAAGPPLAGSRPNIILVMTDDQGMGDLSAHGNELLRTPHLDRFRELSTRFTNFQVSPTCSPTRSAILSGRHEFRNGVTHTILERERMSLGTTTLAQLLAQSGYQTGIFGKWHLGDEEAYQPYHRGFTEVFIHGAGGIGQAYDCSCADFPPNREHPYFDTVVLHNDTLVQTEGFCTDVFFHAALGWIRDRHAAGEPFFALITPNAPHDPLLAPETYRRRFLDLGYNAELAGRYGMIENIDDNVGLLLTKLDEWQLGEHTLVIFMTDNGQAPCKATLNGQPYRSFTAGYKTGKNTPYEGGTHVPAFWRWQGRLGEGVDIPAVAAHIDFFPTVCELAGVDFPTDIQPLDGRSLLPLLEDPAAEWPDRRLFTHLGRWPKGSDPNAAKYAGFAVRTTRWRLVGDELYDIAADPYEAQNVAADHPAVVAELRAAFDAWWEETLPLLVNEHAPNSPTQPQTERYNRQLAEHGIPRWVPPEL
jgi:arylsulfatase A-like enzyme